LGLSVLNGLAELYTSLVWESTLLLALCSDDIIPPGCKFGKEDMEKLLPSEMKVSVYLTCRSFLHSSGQLCFVGRNFVYMTKFTKLVFLILFDLLALHLWSVTFTGSASCYCDSKCAQSTG